jgi:hypothetical protein
MNEAFLTKLEKLDVLRERLGIGYEQARIALNLAEGDVVKALDDYERARISIEGDDLDCQEQGIWQDVRSSLAAFSRSTISLKRNENTIISLSAPLGLALAYTIWRKPGLRLLALVGAVGATVKDFELELAINDEKTYQDNIH